MTTAIATIPMFDCVEQHARLREEIHAAIRDVLAAGTLILGPCVRRFERSFAEYLGGGFGIGVGNGTDALAIALRALGVGPGDEVITVAHTALPTVSAICMTGARPVFCDVDRETLLMDLDDVRRRITGRTRAILPVHLYGNAVDMPALVELARGHGLYVVEDCAQSCGTTLDGRHTGTFGDVGCFSFYPTKNLGACGDGGLCFTRDERLAESMRRIRHYGRGDADVAQSVGVNSRLDELQAAVLEVKLRHLPAFLTRRRALAREYQQQLDPGLARPRTTPLCDHSYHLLVVRSPRRGTLIERLQAEQIGHGIHYAHPVHLMPAYGELGYRRGSLPATEAAAREVLSLPCYPELPVEAVGQICRVLNDA